MGTKSIMGTRAGKQFFFWQFKKKNFSFSSFFSIFFIAMVRRVGIRVVMDLRRVMEVTDIINNYVLSSSIDRKSLRRRPSWKSFLLLNILLIIQSSRWLNFFFYIFLVLFSSFLFLSYCYDVYFVIYLIFIVRMSFISIKNRKII